MKSLMSHLLIGCCFITSLGAQSPAPPYFSVRDYGASGEKSQNATQALQAALDACHKAGGGTVYLPPGAYTSGTIRMRSYTRLHLAAGATLFASQDTLDYTFYNKWKNPILLVADSAHHIALSGQGTIHGQARRTYESLKSVDKFIAKITENARRAGVEMKMYYKVKPHVRLVSFFHSSDIHIQDLSLIESCSWTLDLKACDRVFIRGLYIESSLEAGVNSDGIDIDACRDVVISDCQIYTGDDAIVLKANYSGRDRPQRHCENVTVSNCVVSSSSTGLKIGTESYGDFRHITFTNCVVRDANRGLSIVIRDGGTVEDVLFSNITIDTRRRHFNWWGDGDPIWLVLRKRRPNSRLGQIRNVSFDHIIAHAQGSSRIEGYAPDAAHPAGRKLENIRLSRLQLFMEAEAYRDKRADHALAAHDVEGLHLQDITVGWDDVHPEARWQSALACQRVSGLRVRQFTGRQGLLQGPYPMIRLESVSDVWLSDLEAMPGTGTVVELVGKENRQLYLKNIDLMNRSRQKLKAEPDQLAEAIHYLDN